MPYALCPMLYAHEYLIFLRKAILAVNIVKVVLLTIHILFSAKVTN